MSCTHVLLVVFASTIKSWAQMQPPASLVGLTEEAPGENVPAGVATEQAMAESAFLAMSNITGVPTVAPGDTASSAAAGDGDIDSAVAAVEGDTASAGDIDSAAAAVKGDAASAAAAASAAVSDTASAAASMPSPSPIMDDGIGIGTTPQPLGAAGEVAECKVLAGPTAKVMQGVLFLCCCGVLALKFHREAGSRTPSEFMLDSTKQLFGAGWIHVLNLCFAKGLEAQYQAGDECTWYWLNIVLDCTLGVAVEYVLMLGLTACIKSSYPSHADDFETGDYKNADGSILPARYIKQLGLWLLIVTLMKVCMFLIMTIGHESLSSIAKAILSPFAFDATAKLFAVMIFTPICMNAFQFWMVDNFIKKSADGSRDPSMADMEYDGSMRTRIQHGGL